MKNENNFFRIDRSNNFTFSTSEEEQSLTLSLFMLIASISDESIGSEINKYLHKLIPPNIQDIYKINLFLLSRTKHNFNSVNSHFNTILNLQNQDSSFQMSQSMSYRWWFLQIH